METCVTFTWIQLNLRLFELTGDPRSIELAEEAAWNQLLPALSPEGDTWNYFMSLVGPKRFYRKWLAGVKAVDNPFPGAPITCCHTNGQRGLALLPLYAYSIQDGEVLVVNFYGPYHATVNLSGIGQLRVEQFADFPAAEDIILQFTPSNENPYHVSLRIPAWAEEMLVNQQPAPKDRLYFDLRLQGEQAILVHFKLSPRVILSGFEARGKCSIGYGPLIFALDRPPLNSELDQVILNLGHEDPRARMEVRYEDGWPQIRIPACRIPAQATFEPIYEPIGAVDLIPVLFAGLKGNPGLVETLDGESMPFFNQEKTPITRFPEYRVLMPFFWSPG
jgi:DUF1680 family protein